jgi:hypothetical protein
MIRTVSFSITEESPSVGTLTVSTKYTGGVTIVSHIVTTVGFKMEGSFLAAWFRCHVALHPVSNPTADMIDMILCHCLFEFAICLLIFINSFRTNFVACLLINITHNPHKVIFSLRIVQQLNLLSTRLIASRVLNFHRLL